MGRLIDADALLKHFEMIQEQENAIGLDFVAITDEIKEQPTAYDPDKVVEQLEDYGNEETHYYKNTPYEKCIEECIGKAIQIAKGGGVDERS